MADVSSSRADVVKGPIDDDATEKRVPVRHFDPQSYRCEDAWLTIFQVDKVQKSFLAVLQKQEEDSLRSIQANKYQYYAGLVTVASLSSGKLSVANVDSSLKHGGKRHFL